MRHITITGSLGSGKTLMSSILKEKTGMEIESVGGILRKMAQDQGMSTNEFNKYMEEHPELDHELDSFVKEQGLSTIPKIFDSRLAWNFIPQSFKVYLYVKDDIAAKRVYNDNVRINEIHESEIDAQLHIAERRKSEILRYKTQYDIDLDKLTNYNLVIDTSHSAPEEIANIIIKNYKKDSSTQNDIWISPHTLLPTQGIRNHSLPKIEFISPFFSGDEDYVDNLVKVVFDNNQFYIYDGHKRVLHAIKSKKTFLPCLLINPTNNSKLPNGQFVKDYIHDNFSQKYYDDWNEFVGYLTELS